MAHFTNSEIELIEMRTNMRPNLLTSAVLFASILAAALAHAQTPRPLYQDPTQPPAARAADLVSRMTLEEKAAQMVNTAPAIPRLGVPAYDFWSEGLHGIARSGYATMFPQAIGMAATWDAPLVRRIGETISTEARAKNADALRHDNHSIYFGLTVWSPNINIFRDPRWGRGQETYGEDPFLTARLGVNFVRGLQGDDPKFYRVIATPKHYAVHSGPESERHRFNVDPSPHDLNDTYLPAFRATITEAKADSIMCAYNAIDGAPACANRQLLVDILRHDWNFQGFVTSDCGAVDDFFQPTAHHTSPTKEQAAALGVRSGTDTNCGDTYLALPAAVKQGLVSEAEIDTDLRRLFEARMRLGLFDPVAQVPYAQIPMSEVNSPAHRALALQASREAMVLLKNDRSTLPLKSPKTIAVIGPNAASLLALEGNYNAIPLRPILPVDGIRAEFAGAHVLYAQGSPYAEGLPLPAPRTLFHPDAKSAQQGLKGEYFAGDSLSGKPVLTRVDPQIDFDWTAASPAPGVPAERFSVRWSGTITAPSPGSYPFDLHLQDCYPCQDRESFVVNVDGKTVSTFSSKPDFGRSNKTPPFTLDLPDTQPHLITVEYHHDAPIFGAGLSLTWTPPPAVLQKEALAAARQADVVLAFVGLTAELEGEESSVHIPGFSGGDRTDLNLPAPQQQLLEALGSTGKPLVVVLLNGSALSVNWAQEHAAAILEAWYPGESGGQAIAETLSGKNNPGGRLPVTFYTSLDELPAFTDYSMSNRTYRYFKGKPLYPFGYGLSYTSFRYSNVKLSADHLQAGDPLTVSADVQNAGPLAGDEVAELYIAPPQSKTNPTVALSGFERLHLAPNETRHITLTVNPRQISTVDATGRRRITPGTYHASLGGAQPVEGKGDELTFTITGEQELPR